MPSIIEIMPELTWVFLTKQDATEELIACYGHHTEETATYLTGICLLSGSPNSGSLVRKTVFPLWTVRRAVNTAW